MRVIFLRIAGDSVAGAIDFIVHTCYIVIMYCKPAKMQRDHNFVCQLSVMKLFLMRSAALQ